MASIFLSPSTQENNIGFGNYNSEEYRMNAIADVVQSTLEVFGVVVQRNISTDTLKQVVEKSNKINPDLHLAIHSNAGGGRGCEVFCYKTDGRIGHKYAEKLYKRISAITPTADRGIKAGFNFYGEGKHMYEVTYTKAPAALIEVNFHDNSADANWIITNTEKIGTEIAYATLEQLGVKDRLIGISTETAYKSYPGLKDLLEKQIITRTDFMSSEKTKYFTCEQTATIISRAIDYLAKK